MTDGEFVTLHAAFEAEHPRDREHAEVMESARAARGLPARRQFPCRGALRETGRVGAIRVVACDACGYETGIADLEPVAAGADVDSEERRPF